MKNDLKVQGLEPGISFRVAAATILNAKAKPMFALEKATRSGKDIEALHDMRVASRRVREAMRIFEPCYETKTFRKHYRGVRRVTRTLGAVRNFDVCIDFFSKFRKRLEEPDAKEAAAYLLKQKKKARRQARKRMLRKLDKLDLKGMKKPLRAFLSDPVRGAEGEDPDMVTRAQVIVEDRLDDLFGYREAIEEESDVDALHQMRIATKRLRYAMETLYIVFKDKEFDELYDTVRGMQELLGDIHDLDVFVDMVGEVRGEIEGRKRTQELAPGMARVEDMFREQRHGLYERFIAFTREEGGDLRDRVLGALTAAPESCPESSPASPQTEDEPVEPEEALVSTAEHRGDEDSGSDAVGSL